MGSLCLNSFGTRFSVPIPKGSPNMRVVFLTCGCCGVGIRIHRRGA
jgi:hypothetical protein